MNAEVRAHLKQTKTTILEISLSRFYKEEIAEVKLSIYSRMHSLIPLLYKGVSHFKDS